MDDILYIIIIILLVVIIIFFIVRIEYPTTQVTLSLDNQPPSLPEPHDPIMGGCTGTIYGCCPNSPIAKHDYIGSNCSSFHPPLPPHPPIISRPPPHFPIHGPIN